MATDNLNQLGKALKKYTNTIDASTRRVAENFPQIERLRDVIGTVGSYVMEFKTYKREANVSLNLFFQEVFDEHLVALITKMPLTITQTGLSIGLPGDVGAQNVWYPIAYLGDLNFELGSYSVVFTYTQSGTGTFDYKVSFDLGEKIVTPVVVTTGTTITVPLVEANIVSPPTRIIHGVYIYALASSMSVASWLHYATSAIYLNGQPYTPRVIGI